MLSLGLLAFATAAKAQNLGAYFSPCPAAAPLAQVDPAIINGFALATDAICSAPNTPPPESYITCPPPSVVDAYFTDTSVYFRCTASLSPTCDDGCPSSTFCISTTLPSSPTEPFYLCGIPCASGFYICSDTATKYLNPSYTSFCDPQADQCGTCSSFESLLPDGSCAPSAVISALPVRASARKRRSEHITPGVSARLDEAIDEMDCPRGTRKCMGESGDEADWEW
ncbi:hypothetical protein NliqN6_0906 [Naganishia liquefaciens]|uniref:Uncharacterized protein n=1 Tax=Naganishia liquefaciens TaxID=104408 RepID=A0A8H3YCQ1_9TREE|nr:hypothetical protein NliqN6_0906 [Naganishia liquefaciens]